MRISRRLFVITESPIPEPRSCAAWRAGSELARRLSVIPAKAGIQDAAVERRIAASLAPLLRTICPGVRPVDGEEGALEAARRDHLANTDVHAAALGLTCRDDTGASDVYPDASIDLFSPHSYLAALRQPRSAMACGERLR